LNDYAIFLLICWNRWLWIVATLVWVSWWHFLPSLFLEFSCHLCFFLLIHWWSRIHYLSSILSTSCHWLLV